MSHDVTDEAVGLDHDWLRRASQAIAAASSSESALHTLTGLFARAAGARASLLVVLDADGRRSRVRAVWAADRAVQVALSVSAQGPELVSALGAAVSPSGGLPHGTPVREWDPSIAEAEVGYAIPVSFDAWFRGVLYLAFDRAPADLDATVQAADDYSALAAVCMRHGISIGDGGASHRNGNREDFLGHMALRGALAAEIGRSQRYGRPLSVCRIEVDGAVGDVGELERAARDDLLADIGRALSSDLRAPDAIGIIDGGGFVLVLPETGLAQGRALVRRLIASVERATLATPGLGVTVRSGAAEWSEGDGVDELLEDVDRALAS